MRLSRIAFLSLVALAASLPTSIAQDNSGGFELPVQLIGFPIIIIAVRLANFIKKMTYALNPNTYRSRTKRELLANGNLVNVDEIEKKLVAEMGQGVCIYEKVCSSYARRAPAGPVDIDWNDIFRKYATYPKDLGENYILSVFLGDIVGSPALCRGLAKRGRDCETPGRGLLPFTSPLPHPPLPHIYNFHSQIASR